MKTIIVALLTVFILSASVDAADKTRIGIPDFTAQFGSLPLGQKLGFFQAEGLQAEIIRMNAVVGLTALVSGEIDYYTVISPAIAGAIQGAPIRLVACTVPSAPFALIARPEFKSVQDLRGKSIGLNTFGGNIEVVSRLILKHFGLDPDKDIKFLALGVSERRFAAMKQGLAAATLGSPPLDFFGQKMGFVVLTRAHELFSYPASGVVANLKKIKERPDEVKRMIKAGIRTNRYFLQNREGTIQAMAEWMKIDKETATATYDSAVKAYSGDGNVPEEGLRLIIEETKKQAKINREVSLADVADISLLREVQREMGIK
jgi:ABC-type nitrate/sulfonate/bicarbonate transport system substrate-binding protein